MVLEGDYNLSEEDRDKLKEELGKQFHLELENYPAEQTTPSSSCTESTFNRYMHIICKPYMSYFHITLYPIGFLCTFHK